MTDKITAAMLPTTNPAADTFQSAVTEILRPTNISITSSTSLTAVTHGNSVITVSGSGTVILTLPSAVGFNSRFIINIGTGYTGTGTIATVSSQTINGSASPHSFYPGESFFLFSDGATWVKVATALFLNAGETFVLSGKSGSAIKVGKQTPRFTWDDLKGSFQVDPSGANAPSFDTVVSGIEELAYNATDKARYTFHLEHRERVGGEKYLHLHFKKANAATASGSNLSVSVVIQHSRGHGHKNYGDGTITASPSTITKTFTVTPTQFNNLGAGSHDISELLFAQSGGGAGLLDSDIMLPDDNISITLTVSTIPTLSGGTSSKVFLPQLDIHREVIDGSGTAYKDTSGGSFYVT